MSFESELFAFLIDHPALEPLHGDRVYPTDLEANTVMPAVTYLRVDRPVSVTHDGSSGLVNPRYQFDLYADDHETLVELETAYRSVFEGKRITIGPYSVRSFPAGDRGGRDDESLRFRGTLDYILWYHE